MSPRADTAVRVLVLDASVRQALAACRALGRGGHEVGTAGWSAGAVASRSRHSARYHRLPSPGGAAAPFEDALAAVVAAHRYEAIVAVDDRTLARLDTVDVPVPSVPMPGRPFRLLTEKLELGALARRAGVDYPATCTLDEFLAHGARRFPFPLVVKSARSGVATAEYAELASGARVVDDLASLEAAGARLAAKGHVAIVQERVWTSRKLNVVLIRRDGRSELRYAHEALRESPPQGGLGVTLRTVDAGDPDVLPAVEALERVCDAAGYEGLVQAELYVEPGRAWLIDVNPRLWGSTWFAERLGLRVTERAVAVALGRSAAGPVGYPVGRTFHHLGGELRWASLHRPAAPRLLELVRTTRPWDVFEYADLSDPAPPLALAVDALRRRVSRS
jgi:hypothetical protein